MADPPINIVTEPSSVIANAITVLGQISQEPAWVLVGGIAVFCRLGAITRATQDADTIAANQADLAATLGSQGDRATILSAGKVEINLGQDVVHVDVMDANH